MRKQLPQLGIAVRLTLVCIVAVGLYTLAMTGVAQALFQHQANGSLLTNAKGQVVGSALIGQSFTSDKYFHSRPSATTDASGNPDPYNAANSSASNLGPTNPALILAVEQNADQVRCDEGLPPGPPDIVTPTPAPSPTPGATPTASPTPSPTPCPAPSQAQQPIPVDAVTASGSGLDPDISVAYAELQVPRVAKARGLSDTQVEQLVQQHTDARQLGVLGEPAVNVLQLNLALDRLQH
jgi:potassium-transporting ATPase KdpC subunit